MLSFAAASQGKSAPVGPPTLRDVLRASSSAGEVKSTPLGPGNPAQVPSPPGPGNQSYWRSPRQQQNVNPPRPVIALRLKRVIHVGRRLCSVPVPWASK